MRKDGEDELLREAEETDGSDYPELDDGARYAVGDKLEGYLEEDGKHPEALSGRWAACAVTKVPGFLDSTS